jgi:hypothetical protein
MRAPPPFAQYTAASGWRIDGMAPMRGTCRAFNRAALVLLRLARFSGLLGMSTPPPTRLACRCADKACRRQGADARHVPAGVSLIRC